MRSIHAGIALFAAEELRVAASPLFQAGVIDALEWTVDLGWTEPLPDWVTALLDHYGAEGRLYGHGVTLSPTTAGDPDPAWLERLARDPFRYRHVTEHWGFSRGRRLAINAPLPLVASEAVVASTTRALRALAAAARVPVGLENLALAMSEHDVLAQPAMLAQVLDAIDGVLLLDLHNVWCQAVNYRRDPRELVARYPLARVRELHVAGGSWSTTADGGRFRRDTHDALAPDEVLELVAWTIPRCPALEVVILERLPTAIDDHDAWRAEVTRLAAVVQRAAAQPIVAPLAVEHPRSPAHAIDEVAAFQDAMTEVLLAGGELAALLAHPSTAPFRDQVARWEPRAFAVAVALAATWGYSTSQP